MPDKKSPRAVLSAENDLEQTIAEDGFAFVPAEDMQPQFAANGSLSDWEAFAASWGDLPVDTYMADKGRYRRRRYAVFYSSAEGVIKRDAHQPHYQTVDYNHLHGGVERWFEPILPVVGDSQSLAAILRFCQKMFTHLAGSTRAWHIEVHQFRIETGPQMKGLPTPEGMHRDGVDYVLVLMIRRQNIKSGTTMIHALDQTPLGNFTLTKSFDAALVEDGRVYHGVTPVEPLNPAEPAWRDVLVVTFRSDSA